MGRTKFTSPSGIYQIQSMINGKIYIGSAVNLKRRKIEHFCALNLNKHHSQYLQRHYNKYGKWDLLYSILEFCSKENLLEKEQYWIDKVFPKFNMYLIANSPLGTIWSEERKKQASLDRKGKKHKPHSAETKLNIGLAHLGKRRTPFSKEHKNNMRESAKGNTNWLDKHHSKKTKIKMGKTNKLYWDSEKGKERKQSLSILKSIPILYNFKYFRNVGEAAVFFKLNRTTIYKYLKQRKKGCVKLNPLRIYPFEIQLL